MILGILVFLVLVYLYILENSALDDSMSVRCSRCGHTYHGSKSGVNSLAEIKAFSNVIDWCPMCGSIGLHDVRASTS